MNIRYYVQVLRCCLSKTFRGSTRRRDLRQPGKVGEGTRRRRRRIGRRRDNCRRDTEKQQTAHKQRAKRERGRRRGRPMREGRETMPHKKTRACKKRKRVTAVELETDKGVSVVCLVVVVVVVVVVVNRSSLSSNCWLTFDVMCDACSSSWMPPSFFHVSEGQKRHEENNNVPASGTDFESHPHPSALCESYRYEGIPPV
jgi:hypothetical protein